MNSFTQHLTGWTNALPVTKNIPIIFPLGGFIGIESILFLWEYNRNDLGLREAYIYETEEHEAGQ